MIRCVDSLNWFETSHCSISKRCVYPNTASQPGRKSEGGRIQITTYIGSHRRSTLTGVSIRTTPRRVNELVYTSSAIPREGYYILGLGPNVFWRKEFIRASGPQKDGSIDTFYAKHCESKPWPLLIGNKHFFYGWGTAYHNHIPALQGGIAERAAEAHAIHATNGSSSPSSISAERLHGWRISFASVTFVDRMGTHLQCLLQAARKLKQLKYFGERTHVRPINRHRHITAKSHEVPDIIKNENTLQLWDRRFRRNSSLQAVCDTPIARITSCVSSLRI